MVELLIKFAGQDITFWFDETKNLRTCNSESRDKYTILERENLKLSEN